MADEGDFITLLVASERVGAWCDVLRLYLAQGGSLPRVKQTVRDLKAALDSEAYAEEVGGSQGLQLGCVWLKARLHVQPLRRALWLCRGSRCLTPATSRMYAGT